MSTMSTFYEYYSQKTLFMIKQCFNRWLVPLFNYKKHETQIKIPMFLINENIQTQYLCIFTRATKYDPNRKF